MYRCCLNFYNDRFNGLRVGKWIFVTLLIENWLTNLTEVFLVNLLSVRLVRKEWTVLEPVLLNTMDDCAKASVTVPYIYVTESMDV